MILCKSREREANRKLVCHLLAVLSIIVITPFDEAEASYLTVKFSR